MSTFAPWTFKYSAANPGAARRLVPALAAGACLLTALSACAGGAGGATGPSSASSDLTVVYANQVTTIDPVQAVQAEVDTIASLIYDPLVTYNSKDQLAGVIAQTFTTEPGATTVPAAGLRSRRRS